jgi:hypothetical protein
MVDDSNQEEQDRLANQIVTLALGRPTGMLMNACLNVLIECILLRRKTRLEAEHEFDTLMPAVKAGLMDRYDAKGNPKIVLMRQ